jgi:hypothetical protein
LQPSKRLHWTETLRLVVDVGVPSKTVIKEARKAAKTWNEVKRQATNRTRWRSFTDSLCSRRVFAKYY